MLIAPQTTFPLPSEPILHSSCQPPHDMIPPGRQQACLKAGAAFWMDGARTLQNTFVAAEPAVLEMVPL